MARIAVFGSRDWDNYPDVMRTLTVFIEDAKADGDNEVIFVHAPNRGADDMVTEYVGKVEKFLRQKDFRIKEQLIRKEGQALTDLAIIESGITHAIIFTTGCRRTRTCDKLLVEYEIPTTIVK
jgi:hypothetical protein